MDQTITPKQFHEADGVDDWRVIGDGACAVFRTATLAAGARFAQAISALDGHPNVDLRSDTATIRLISRTPSSPGSPGFFGLTERDLELARQISAVAVELGLAAEPGLVQNIEVCIDALAYPEVFAFWRAILGYEDRGDLPVDLIDPLTRGPLTFFQEMDRPRPQRNRIHLDVWVAHDRAEARVKAALEAGGTLVNDEYAPHFWVLADAEGNEACVCTWQERGQ